MPNHNGGPWVWLTKSAHRLAGGLIIQFCTFFQAEEFIASNLHMACHLANVIFDFEPVNSGNGWKLPTLKWLCMEMCQVEVWPLRKKERVFFRLYLLNRKLGKRENTQGGGGEISYFQQSQILVNSLPPPLDSLEFVSLIDANLWPFPSRTIIKNFPITPRIKYLAFKFIDLTLAKLFKRRFNLPFEFCGASVKDFGNEKWHYHLLIPIATIFFIERQSGLSKTGFKRN